MTDPAVVALLDCRPPAAPAVHAALAAGSPTPGELIEIGPRRPLAAAVAQALGAGADWVWLLDGRAIPDADALGALLRAADQAPAPALLLASVVRTLDGDLHPGTLARHEIFEKDRSVAAAGRGLVQLRAAGPGSLLIARAGAQRFAPPGRRLPGDLHVVEWTVRMLRGRDDLGYLVPASRAVRTDPGPGSIALWPAWARLLASPGWSPTERLWETYRLATGASRARPSRRPRRITRPAAGAK